VARLFESHQNKWRTPHQEKGLRPPVLIRFAVLRESRVLHDARKRPLIRACNF
jgi:hypothetical protein